VRRARPHTKIIVTGCAAQTEPGTYAAMPEVDLVLGNHEKLQPESYSDFGIGEAERVRVNDIFSVRETAAHFVDSFDGRARAFLQVQNGCDHRCTFCIIPYGRGNSRSVPMGSAIEETRLLTAHGFGEIVLTGVDLTAYGADLPGKPTLGQLCAKILKLVPELRRLRLSSIDSVEADADLMRLMAEEERLAPHFHLSAQSGDDLILKRMKRRHSRRHVIDFCEAVRRVRPDVAFGADLIAGFPTETEEMFENTLKLVDDAGLSYLHVFPFSPRKRTPATRMPQVSKPVIKERASLLRAKGAAALDARLRSLVGSEQSILVEKAGFGRTACFAPAELRKTATPGAFVRARIAASTAKQLIAELQ
jgi:threonylcarbamoyladenosine tRNA methylthiotransferase MtaB